MISPSEQEEPAQKWILRSMHFYYLVLCQAAVATSHVHVAVLFCLSIRRKLSFPENSRSHSTEAALIAYALYPCPSELATLREEAESELSTVCGVCKHTVDLCKKRGKKYLARMKGTHNQIWNDHERWELNPDQSIMILNPETTELFLTPYM